MKTLTTIPVGEHLVEIPENGTQLVAVLDDQQENNLTSISVLTVALYVQHRSPLADHIKAATMLSAFATIVVTEHDLAGRLTPALDKFRSQLIHELKLLTGDAMHPDLFARVWARI